jgi:hypothetical protein
MVKQYVLNLGLLLNYALMTLIGQDPRKTISAWAYLKGYDRLVAIVNRIYKNPQHCAQAAQGWDRPDLIDRSLW